MKRLRRILFLLPCAATVLAAGAFVTAAWLGSLHLVSPPRRDLQGYHREILDSPAEFGLRVQPFTSSDGSPCLLVAGDPHPGRAEKSRILRDKLQRRSGAPLPPWGAQLGTIVMFYGHRGRKEDHLPICERFCAAGFRCLLVDIPGQGDHPEATGSFGLRESLLAGRVLDDAVANFAFPSSPAFLFGVSQGGAIALQAAALEPWRWDAVASVATFASLDRPVLRSAEELIPDYLKFCRPLAAFSVACGTEIRAGFRPADIRPVDAAAMLQLPVMIVHGDRDTYVDIGQGREIFAAVPAVRKQFRVVRGGDHHRVLATGSHELYADLCHFFLTVTEEPIRSKE